MNQVEDKSRIERIVGEVSTTSVIYRRLPEDGKHIYQKGLTTLVATALGRYRGRYNSLAFGHDFWEELDSRTEGEELGMVSVLRRRLAEFRVSSPRGIVGNIRRVCQLSITMLVNNIDTLEAFEEFRKRSELMSTEGEEGPSFIYNRLIPSAKEMKTLTSHFRKSRLD